MKQTYRKHSRKGNCEICGVQTGSKHNKMCLYAYFAEKGSKSYQLRKTK